MHGIIKQIYSKEELLQLVFVLLRLLLLPPPRTPQPPLLLPGSNRDRVVFHV